MSLQHRKQEICVGLETPQCCVSYSLALEQSGAEIQQLLGFVLALGLTTAETQTNFLVDNKQFLSQKAERLNHAHNNPDSVLCEVLHTRISVVAIGICTTRCRYIHHPCRSRNTYCNVMESS